MHLCEGIAVFRVQARRKEGIPSRTWLNVDEDLRFVPGVHLMALSFFFVVLELEREIVLSARCAIRGWWCC
jgi:hypothetical protein